MATSFKQQLDKANPNQLADFLREMGFADFVQAMPVQLNKKSVVVGANANGNIAAVHIYKTPDGQKAAMILRCTGRAGTVLNEFAPQAYGTTPATTQCAVTPCGDIAFVAADAVTDFDVWYLPQKGEVVEFEGNLATGVLTIPPQYVARGVMLLMEAEITAGTVTGKKGILVPLASGGAGLPAAGRAQLTSNKSTVSFNDGTDAGTKAKVKILVAPATDLAAKLASDARF
jgi:hypothetical protein